MPPQSLICWPESLSHTCPGNITDRRLIKTCWEMDSLRANLLMSNHWESQISANTLCWLAPAVINFKQWVDINTKESPQITSIKEPPQKNNILLRVALATQLKEASCGGWAVRGWGMSPDPSRMTGGMNHKPCPVILNEQHQDPGVLAQLLLHSISLPCVSLWGDPVWRLTLTGPGGPGLRGYTARGSQVSLSSSGTASSYFLLFLSWW